MCSLIAVLELGTERQPGQDELPHGPERSMPSATATISVPNTRNSSTQVQEVADAGSHEPAELEDVDEADLAGAGVGSQALQLGPLHRLRALLLLVPLDDGVAAGGG
jgi:hypothetical protein